MESEVTGNCHASFGERDAETRSTQAEKVRCVPTPFSPVLANLALDGLERKLRERYPKATARSRKAQANLARFADDFIITGRTKALLEQEVKPLVELFLRERGLELSAEKTRITHIEEGFDFLGQHVRKYHDGKVLIKPSRAAVAALLTKVRTIIKANKQATPGYLISILNPVIRGWANYHCVESAQGRTT